MLRPSCAKLGFYQKKNLRRNRYRIAKLLGGAGGKTIVKHSFAACCQALSAVILNSSGRAEKPLQQSLREGNNILDHFHPCGENSVQKERHIAANSL
jgi:hypothetical protein